MVIKMKTVIYVNNQNNKRRNDVEDFILGILFIILSFTGLFMNSKLILKLVMYLIPIALILYSIHLYKLAYSLYKTDKKHSLIFLIQGILLSLAAIYVLIFPIQSLNYILIFIGAILIINAINKMMLTGSTVFFFFPFLLGILLMLFSNQIIKTFYTLFLIILLFTGISKVIQYFYNRKN